MTTGGSGAVVLGGAGGAAARLEELDALAVALADAAADCAELVGVVVAEAARATVGAGPGMGGGGATVVDPRHVAVVVDGAADAVGGLVQAGAELARSAAAVAATAAAYRACEASVSALARAVPVVVGTRVRVAAAVAGASGPGPLLVVAGAAAGGLAVVAVAGARGDVAGVDLLVRAVPALLGTTDVATSAQVVSRWGDASGLLVETPVDVGPGPPAAACVAPAAGVADLLRRGQSVAAWREPGPGEHDTLPPGATRPVRGQVRIDRITGADGEVSWVVHVPGTQEWDGDGRGSPMDLAGNLALVGGRDTAVATGVATALVAAGVRRGDPVAVVGHSQGGMTALDLAGDPGVRRVATITHVVTAGSPLAGRTPPPGVQVLALEHRDDLVPRLDGRDHPDRRDRVTVVAPAPDGPWRGDAVPAHSSSAYVVTAARVDASDHPSLVAYRAGLAPFLARDGASCASRHVVLTRSPGPHR